MANQPDINNIKIKLGDIIQIISPEDETIHEEIYYIIYIDLELIELINEDCEKKTLYIKDNRLINESIKQIIILSRSSENGYARQNNLLTNTWINIYFNGDLPFIITGKITNLVEDQIEIKVYNSDDLIYIDFKYQGLPKDLPIEKINIRNAPSEKEDNIIDDDKLSEESVDDILITKNKIDKDSLDSESDIEETKEKVVIDRDKDNSDLNDENDKNKQNKVFDMQSTAKYVQGDNT